MDLLSPSSSAVLDANALAAQQVPPTPGMENSSELAAQLLQQRPRSAARPGGVAVTASSAMATAGDAAAAAAAAANHAASANAAASSAAAAGLAAAVSAEQDRAVLMVSGLGF